MGNDNRCTLRHDPIDADRDMPCYFCIKYGHISEPRVSMDMRREQASLARVQRKQRAAARVVQADAVALLAEMRRAALKAEIAKLQAENAKLKAARR